MVTDEQNNGKTTICITTEEEWRKNTTEEHDLGYIKRFCIIWRKHLLTSNNRVTRVFQTFLVGTSRTIQWIDVILQNHTLS